MSAVLTTDSRKVSSAGGMKSVALAFCLSSANVHPKYMSETLVPVTYAGLTSSSDMGVAVGSVR